MNQTDSSLLDWDYDLEGGWYGKWLHNDDLVYLIKINGSGRFTTARWVNAYEKVAEFDTFAAAKQWCEDDSRNQWGQHESKSQNG